MIEKEKIDFKKLRVQSGMNKKQFSEYFEIPYRTIQHWETEGIEKRRCPEYVLKLIEFRLKTDKLID